MAKNGIFELNGKAYDALTGELLGDARHIQRTPAQQHSSVQPSKAPASPVIIGGLSAPHKRPSNANHVTAHQPQPTKTLMRRSVNKPAHHPTAVKPAASIRAHSNAIHVGRTLPSAVQQKPGTTSIDAVRAHRATAAPHSQAVKHFRPMDMHPTQTHKVVAAQQPTPQPVIHSDIKVIHPHQAVPQTAANRRAIASQRTAAQFSLNQQTNHQASQQRATHQPQLTARHQQQVQHAPAGQDKEHDLFSEALAHATSHEEQAPKESVGSKIKHKSKKRKRVLSIVATAALFLLICGFVGIQNKENIQLQIAGAKAGFSVATPLYKPDGYAMSKMTYSAGSVATLYKNTGNQSFSLSQKKSNWDSQTLLENFVASEGEDYKGFQSNGRTVYVYGKGKATWVNGGIWYQIQGADELTNEELVKIAASM